MTLPLVSIFVLIGLAGVITYKLLVYPAFLSPLSKIPNAHPTAPFSEAWILWTRYNMRNNRATLAAHCKYGPIVRMAPNELSINCVDGGIRTVYAGGFEKHDWYPRLFPSYGVINMFSTVEHGPHSAKKRLMSNIYSKSHLQGSPQVHENSLILLRDRFLPFIQKSSSANTAVDVHNMNNGFTMDFMSAYQFGLACSTKFSIYPSTKHHYLQQYHSRKEYEFHAQEIPHLRDWCKWLGFPLVPKEIETANNFIEDMGMKMCESANAYLDDLPSPGAEPVVYKQFKHGLAKQRHLKMDGGASQKEADQQRLEVASEMLDHLGAGHETSAIALTYLYYEMSRCPDLQERLRQEASTLSPRIIWPPTAALELPSPKSLDALPLLHAIIMETLRLHAPIPGLEPRITPPGGCTLAGYRVPGKVRVSAMPYALHRNGDVFPEPESWRPERWLKASETEMKEMLRWFWAFGSGGRMCIGSNLAMQEMKLIVAAIYTNWRTVIVDDEGIEEIDAYTTRPRSNRLMLRFHHV